MKLDEEYFEDICSEIGEIHLVFDPKPGIRRVIKLLKRIAQDASEAQARADRVALDTWAGQNDIDGNFYESMINALDAAEIKSEKI